MNLPHPTEAADEPPAHALLFDDEAERHEAESACTEATCAEIAKPGCPPLDDAQLEAWIAGIVDHDERALLALYEATLSRVYGLVLRLVRRAQLAEEVAEEVYFQVWRQAPRFDPERGRPLTWLLGMARSRAIDAIRREARFSTRSWTSRPRCSPRRRPSRATSCWPWRRATPSFTARCCCSSRNRANLWR